MDTGRVHDVPLDDLRAGLSDGSVLLVDVREDHEVANGTIPGSVSMPLSRFDPSALAVDPARRLVFSCASGVRSLVAVDRARSAGLAADAHFGLGFKGWAAAGEPVV